MVILIDGQNLNDLIDRREIDEVSRAFGHLANALEKLDQIPEDHLYL